MSIPAELKYSSDHEWLRVEGKTAVFFLLVLALYNRRNNA